MCVYEFPIRKANHAAIQTPTPLTQIDFMPYDKYNNPMNAFCPSNRARNDQPEIILRRKHDTVRSITFIPIPIPYPYISVRYTTVCYELTPLPFDVVIDLLRLQFISALTPWKSLEKYALPSKHDRQEPCESSNLLSWLTAVVVTHPLERRQMRQRTPLDA